ncbi:DUF4232 domain-containing protein [Pseudonocardia sp. KRD291]|uniref:DUF4232 domain-containing protein n=1 Tax=Pseudonocardia sp. KRD291 TaxID=2792007 RepID=UPI001C4A39A0|nr:DUF4232 domain-containing protein [Pseudonocardia sp. KRD291]MBW0101589.1 DUF4232 domain-containing protein [Pseudonocardia sp. KRD291]
MLGSYRTKKTTTVTRTLAATGIAAAAILTPLTAGVATAAPVATVAAATGTDAAPSACRPANYRGTVSPDAASSGHRHYRVTLVAAPGTSACTLAGSPDGAAFWKGQTPIGVNPRTYGDQAVPVAFGPGAPVHFDIQVPNSAGGATAGTVRFSLRAPDGAVIPGEGAAGGYMEVDAGTAIGPVRPGV